MKKLILLLAAAVGLSSLPAMAQTGVPQLINYQGQLLTPQGAPIANGDYTIQIALFPVESGGAVVWGPQTFNGQSGTGLGPKVAVVVGHFNLIIGPKDTADRNLMDAVADHPNLFLEIKVGSGTPITPRQQLLTAPYSLNSANATRLNGYDWSPIFSNGDPVNGNFAVGVDHSTTDAKADINGRMRVRQGIFGSSGIWFHQNSAPDRAFVGMLDDNRVGFYTAAGAGWAFTVDVTTGYSSALGLNLGDLSPLNLGPARLAGSTSFFGPGLLFKSFYVGGVDNSYFDGDIWANGVRITSDERLKENIAPIESPLDKLQEIRGVGFNFKPAASGESHHRSSGRQLGVLAQEVQKVLPEAVSTGPDGSLAVSYDALIPVLLEAVKAQQQQIEELRGEVAALQGASR